jgi:hypothetical protein
LFIPNPLRSFFTEEGEYKVFAYVQNHGSKKGGGDVTVTVSEPKFVSLEWKDANGKSVRYTVSRHVVYAHTKLEGLNERIRYFNKAVEVLYVKKCLSGNSISSKDSQGTIIFINGMSYKYGTEFKKNEKNRLFTNYVYIKI